MNIHNLFSFWLYHFYILRLLSKMKREKDYHWREKVKRDKEEGIDGWVEGGEKGGWEDR